MAPTRDFRFYILLPLAIFICIHISHCFHYDIIQERCILAYYDPDYFKNVSVRTGRRGRGMKPETNITIVVPYPLGNNVTENNTIYELRSNEYRRGFFDISYKLCDMIDHEKVMVPYFERALGRKVTCPLQGKYTLTYSNIDSRILPRRVPWTSIMMETIGWTKKDGINIRFLSYMRFKEILDKPRPKINKSPRRRKPFY